MAKTRVAAATKAAESLFEDASAHRTNGADEEPGRPARSIVEVDQMPAMERGFDGVIESVFDMDADDVKREYEELESSLRLKNAATPGALQSVAANAEELARRAYRLNIVAQYEFSRYERQTSVIVGAMRDAATRKLEEEKQHKLRTKQITEADIAEYCSVLFPDEWAEVNDRRMKAKQMTRYIEALADLLKSRSRTVVAMLGMRGA